jgi:protein-disulfide isomerase
MISTKGVLIMKLKILLAIVLLTLQVSAVDDNGVRHYIKKYMEKKTNSKVNKIETISHYEIAGTNGWEVYFLSLDMNIKLGSSYQKRTVPQVVFTKGNKITFSLKDQYDQSYAKLLKPTVPVEAYDDEHFLVGGKNAPHKILVFSDPFCPYCQEIVPEMITMVEAHPETFGLYYYHLPLLKIHPASDVTTKVMHLLHKKGDASSVKALYHLLLDPKETNVKKILKAIKDKTGKSFSKSDISSSSVNAAMEFDKAMKKRLMVTGTPTIFIDGVWDPTRLRYKNYIK